MNFEKLRKSVFYKGFINTTRGWVGNKRLKQATELLYWRLKKWEEKEFNNSHYQYFYTNYFGLSASYFEDKSILDIGCGPRGSLEWISNRAECIGLDPLAEKYQQLNRSAHQMKYITGHCEDIPFQACYFDIVSAFNSLDHVDEPDKCREEIIRVLKPGGLLLLIVDIHDQPTVTEPTVISWDFLKLFGPHFEILEEKHFEGHRMYKSIRKGVPFDHSDPSRRYGVLTAKLVKRNRIKV